MIKLQEFSRNETVLPRAPLLGELSPQATERFNRNTKGMTEASAIPQYNINRAKVQRSSGLLYFLRGRCRVRFDQPDPNIAEQQRVSCRRMGALAALRVVPD